MSDSCPVYTCR